MKNYNVMSDGQNFFDQPVRNDLVTYYNIRKILQQVKEIIILLVVC